jgi:hypothetical protein
MKIATPSTHPLASIRFMPARLAAALVVWITGAEEVGVGDGVEVGGAGGVVVGGGGGCDISIVTLIALGRNDCTVTTAAADTDFVVVLETYPTFPSTVEAEVVVTSGD